MGGVTFGPPSTVPAGDTDRDLAAALEVDPRIPGAGRRS